jgi:hypothetical protein
MDPLHFGNLGPHPDPHPNQLKIRIRIWIRIKVISWLWNPIRIRIMTSQNVWNMGLFEHFF